MPAEWPVVKVEEVCELIVDCVNKTAPIVPYETPYRMIRTTNVRNGRIDLSECRYVEKETFDKWTRRAKLLIGDVVLTREAPIGEVGLVREAEGVFLGQRLMQYRGNPRLLDSRFLFYAYLSPSLQHQFRSHEGSGSVVSHIRVGDCFKFQIPLPPLAEQKAIAHILGTLDDKIELNRKMNETLEAMARALFKSWFVDFDPVRKKQAGQPTGLPAEIEGLFPSEFEDSALGEIPKGWRVGKLSEFIRILSGGTPKTSVTEYWNGSIPWFSVVDSPSTSDVFVWDTEKKITQAGVDNSAASLLPAGTTVVTARGTVGKTALMARPMSINQSCYGILPMDGPNVYFNYFQIRTMIAELQSKTHGSVFDTITRETFETVNAILPHNDLMFAFENSMKNVMGKILNNNQQNSTLKEVRDTLLPKLISGELRVKDAERFVERK